MDKHYYTATTLPIPDQNYYVSSSGHITFKPWLVPGEWQELYGKVADDTELTVEQLYYVYSTVRQCSRLSGEFWECGTYRGGSGAFIAALAASARKVRLFDTFHGLPMPDTTKLTQSSSRVTTEFDLITSTYADTSVETVKKSLANVDAEAVIHAGKLPAGFAGLEGSAIAYLHVDLSLYRATFDCLEFCYPRMVKNGMILIEGYTLPETSGVRIAVDEFFARRNEFPLALIPGGAIITKL